MTRLFDDENHSNNNTSAPNEGKKTRVLRGGTTLADVFGDDDNEGAAEPVVAWLVIVAGPGKGHAMEMSYGMSSVGRGADNRLSLDFGDDRISETEHFSIAYDGENRNFHIVPGRGKNLVYIQDAPLLNSQLLEPHTELRVGATTLRFVPLCSKDWDWQSLTA